MKEKHGRLGQAIDRLENLYYETPSTDEELIDRFWAGLPDLIAEMKAGFIEATGENPWVDFTDEPEPAPGPQNHEPLD